LRDKQGTNDIPFGKVDIALIENYAYYLKIDLQLAARSVHSYLAPFRTVVRRAFNRGLLRQYPFSEYTHEKEIVKRRYLSGDELERLVKAELKGAALNFIRDMFLFSTFTGLSYSDLKNLQHSHFRQQEDGSRWIVLNRKKTGTASHIPLLDIPLQIIDKYNGTKFSGIDGYVFKVRTKENMNFQLKKIAKAARIDRRLTWHQSRHSFSTTVCLSNGVPIESLSQMLGHLSIKTTQIYAQVTRTKINEDMTWLEKRIEGKYKLAENESKIIETKNLL
jgi:site-specific recombinase XerD